MVTRKRSPEEILDKLEEEDLADEAERVAALSSREVDRELARDGVEPGALRAGAREVFERAMRKRAASLAKTSGDGTSPAPPGRGQDVVEPRADRSCSPAVAPPRVVAVLPGTRRRAGWGRPAVWSATAAVASIGIVVATHAPELVAWVRTSHWGGVEAMPAPPRAGDRDRAEVLRDEATRACGLTLWTTCANKLDEAQKLDPAGESDPSVKKLREALEAARATAPRGANGGD